MINKDDRIIMAKKDILPLKFPVNQRSRGPKPKGLWYAIGTEWIDWVRSEMPEWEGDYLYKIDLNSNNILFLKTYDDLSSFTRKYSDEPSLDTMNINWEKVSNEYSGIEINPYQYKARYDILWYYGWDVASGCIWDKSGIQSINKVKK